MSNRLTSSGMEEKALQIAACLAKNPVDLWELRELALSRGGLLKGIVLYHIVSYSILSFASSIVLEFSPITFLILSSIGKLRQEAWAKLVGLSDSNKNENSNSNSNSNYDPLGAEDEEQEYQRQRQRRKSSSPTASHEEKTIDIALEVDLIRKDVGRSVIFRFRNNERDDWSVATPSGQSSEEEAPKFDKVCCDRLAQVLERTILEPMAGQWHYYQGLHDIAGVLLHNMDYDVKKSTTILRRVCQSHLRDALRENFKSVTWLLDVLLLPLVEQMEPHVHYALLVSEVEMSNVCLPWLITWFTHDIHDRVVAARMVDAFVAGHPLLPFYVAVALLTHPLLKHQIVNADANDPASIFPILKQLPFGIVSDTTTAATPVEDGHTTTVVAQELIEDAISIMYVLLTICFLGGGVIVVRRRSGL
jgi:hypothetical protein